MECQFAYEENLDLASSRDTYEGTMISLGDRYKRSRDTYENTMVVLEDQDIRLDFLDSQLDIESQTERIIKKPKDFQQLVKRPLRMVEPMQTSAIGNFEYPERFPPGLMYKISVDAEEFISKQRKSVMFHRDLISISDRLSEFLEKQGIQARISIDLFVDPEYRGWTEVKIQINVSNEKFEKVYSLYDEMLDSSLVGIHKRSLKNIVINIEKS